MKQRVIKIAIFTMAIMSMACSQQAKWREAERRELREELRAYRDMIYLSNLADAEFELFTGDVMMAIEDAYPVYTTFVELPSQSDTVEVYVVETIVERLNADAHNMRHIFPYRDLVNAGILPAGLNHQAQHSFYDCLSRKVKAYYPSMTAFVNAIESCNATSNCSTANTIIGFQQQCAQDLFDWGIEVDQTILVD